MSFTGLTTPELLTACLEQGSQPAWDEFIRRTQPVIASAAYRIVSRYTKHDSSAVNDLVQDVYLKLCDRDFRILRAFLYKDDISFSVFLRVVTTNLAHDQMRSRFTEKRAENLRSENTALTIEGEEDSLLEVIDEQSVDRIEQQVQLAEIEQKLEDMQSNHTQRDRLIFQLYYRYGYSASEIASYHGFRLSVKGVESILQGTSRWLRVAMQKPGTEAANQEKR